MDEEVVPCLVEMDHPISSHTCQEKMDKNITVIRYCYTCFSFQAEIVLC